jgi:hypothetical protein
LESVKILFFLFMSFAGVIFYMVVTHDTSQAAWIVAGVLGVAVVGASLIGLKQYPELLLRVGTFTALALAIFTGLTWFYTRSQSLGKLLVATAPLAIGLALGSLRFTQRRKASPPRA